MRNTLVLGLCAAIACVAATGAQKPTFRARTDLVSVGVTVSDRRANYLTDLTAEEIQAFLTSVYPVPPEIPLDAVVIKTSDFADVPAAARVNVGAGTYSKALLELGGAGRPSSVKAARTAAQ